MAVRSPLSEEKDLVTRRHILITVIWTTSIVFNAIPIIFSGLKMNNGFVYIRTINLYLFSILPLFAIVIMWGLLIWTAKSKQSHGKIALPNTSQSMEESNSRRMAAIIRRIVILLLICYIPILVWKQYVWIVVDESLNPVSREVKVNFI